MEDDITFYGEYEVHPVDSECWAIVRNGEVRCTFSSRSQAELCAAELDAIDHGEGM